LLYSEYFLNFRVKADFKKEFISLWPAWLGEDNLHRLDEVSEAEWGKFNTLLRLLASEFKILVVDTEVSSTTEVHSIETYLDTYEHALNKDASGFSKFIFPDLDCVLTEDWDYTYILWYRSEKTLCIFRQFIEQAGLRHFSG
jgi:hypothetical protein